MEYDDEYDEDNEIECEFEEEDNNMSNETPKTDPLLETEMALAVREKLKQIIGVDEESLNRLVRDFIYRIAEKFESILRDTAQKTIQAEWTKYIETTTDGRIENVMKTALEEVILHDVGDKVVSTKIHEVILNRVKKFFLDNWDGREKRNKIVNENLDEIIRVNIADKVDVCIEEIKKETVDKFQKEMMKKMMEGIMKSIAQDKRLLGLIDMD